MKPTPHTLAALLLLSSAVLSHAASLSMPPLTDALRRQADAAVARAVRWLESKQAEDGSLGPRKYPAVTALALTAMRSAGGTNQAVIAKAERYVKAFLSKPPSSAMDGHNADICRRLLRLPDPKGAKATEDWASARARLDRDDSARAREFELRQIQWQKDYAELKKKGQGDPDRLMAAKVAHAALGIPEPAESRTSPEKPQPKARRGYGSLTYAGMLGLLHDDVKPDDPRVDAMMDWAERGWSLDSNPGKGQQGLYFFYQALAKCLDAGGEEEITPLTGGTGIRWREQVVRRLVMLQKSEQDGKSGYWVNGDASYMEDDPVLVTSYAVLAIERALGGGE